MLVLGLDLSSSTGWALIENGKLLDYGLLKVSIEDFNVNERPEKSPKYPNNIWKSANQMADLVFLLAREKRPNKIVIENTVRGRNRNTQRWLEWLHCQVFARLCMLGIPLVYIDPSEWRASLNIRLSNEDKKNNRLVRQGKKRGRINKKHLAIRFVNSTFNLNLKVKEDDIADSIALCYSSFYMK